MANTYSVTFRQAHRELRSELENAYWDDVPVNPNKHTIYAYYNERIAQGAGENIAYTITKGKSQ